jgi:hypothetical protein
LNLGAYLSGDLTPIHAFQPPTSGKDRQALMIQLAAEIDGGQSSGRTQEIDAIQQAWHGLRHCVCVMSGEAPVTVIPGLTDQN